MVLTLQKLEMTLARIATRMSIFSICFCLVIPALLKAGEADQVEETSLSDLYTNYKKSLVKEDFEERPGVVSAIRCYYRLCGVHQMVTVFASASKDNPSVLSYSVEVVSTNVPGMKETQIIVNTTALKSGEPKELLDHINASGVFGKPKLIETKDKESGQLIFAERWSRDGKQNSVVIRDFYESRDLDDLMLQMYQLAWNPSKW